MLHKNSLCKILNFKKAFNLLCVRLLGFFQHSHVIPLPQDLLLMFAMCQKLIIISKERLPHRHLTIYQQTIILFDLVHKKAHKTL